jgi:8-oxo-dGTP diphosphatase
VSEAPALVVGAAIVRHGCLLAARRTTPAAVAGRWELPGGKVETGESPGDALVREVREELGCAIEIDDWLDGDQPIGTTHLLRVAVCRLLGAEPRPGDDHDELLWLTPEGLDEVDWLEPDRPFVAALRERLLDGEVLEGGNVGGAVRIGATVRRPTGPWTPAVHALLEHLREQRLRAVPRVHGYDARGREILDYLPGRIIDVDRELPTDAQLEEMAVWARELHDALEPFDHPGPWRFFDVPGADLIAHNDLAPYNVCFVEDRLTGVFDWDLAGPSTRLFELAHLAWTAVPLYRPVPDHVVASRLRLVAEAYGGPSAAEILNAVIPLKEVGVAGIAAWIAAGDPAGSAQAAMGEPGRTERAIADLRARLPTLRTLLGGVS